MDRVCGFMVTRKQTFKNLLQKNKKITIFGPCDKEIIKNKN
jgi:hypothetical protein